MGPSQQACGRAQKRCRPTSRATSIGRRYCPHCPPFSWESSPPSTVLEALWGRITEWGARVITALPLNRGDALTVKDTEVSDALGHGCNCCNGDLKDREYGL